LAFLIVGLASLIVAPRENDERSQRMTRKAQMIAKAAMAATRRLAPGRRRWLATARAAC
jgi:hypothetical protein